MKLNEEKQQITSQQDLGDYIYFVKNDPSLTKLNLGCGFNKKPGFINVDVTPTCLPDITIDLNTETWPWPDNSVDFILLDHVLEHLGETTAQYFHVMREMYRVCKTGTLIEITVPHPRHDNFLHDCTHVRAITPEGLLMFSTERNLQQIADGGQESKLGLVIGVNYHLVAVRFMLENEYQEKLNSGEITTPDIEKMIRSYNNVCYEINMFLEIVKL